MTVVAILEWGATHKTHQIRLLCDLFDFGRDTTRRLIGVKQLSRMLAHQNWFGRWTSLWQGAADWPRHPDHPRHNLRCSQYGQLLFHNSWVANLPRRSYQNGNPSIFKVKQSATYLNCIDDCSCLHWVLKVNITLESLRFFIIRGLFNLYDSHAIVA